MTPTTPTRDGARPPRVHGLDAVRGGALLLGIVLHGLMPYTNGIPWLVEDSRRADWPLVVITSIHTFRMTLFLLMAGYFGRMVVHRRGARSYLRDRTKRILLPLIAFWPVAVMPLGLLAVWHGHRTGTPVLKPEVGGHGGPLAGLDLGHLWFLWVLFQLVVLTLVLRWAARTLCPRLADSAAARVARWLSLPGGVLLAAIPYAITTNLQTEQSGIVAPATLLPDAVALIAYLGAFVTGWLLHRDSESLQRLGRQAWWHSALAVLSTAGVLLTTQVLPVRIDAPQPVWSTLMALAGWSCCYALLGLAVRYLTRERGWVRYLADASYWMYLMHLVVLTVFEVFLAEQPWPPAAKALLNIGLTSAVLLPTYHVVVRSTWLGGWLNGRRAGRSTPRPAPAAARNQQAPQPSAGALAEPVAPVPGATSSATGAPSSPGPSSANPSDA